MRRLIKNSLPLLLASLALSLVCCTDGSPSQINQTPRTQVEASPPADAPQDQIKIVLVGDSILDNCYWVEKSPHKDVGSKIEAAIPHSSVENLAIDQTTTRSLIAGHLPHKGMLRCDPHTPAPEMARKRLEEISTRSESDHTLGQRNTFFVLSVGGNDFKNILKNNTSKDIHTDLFGLMQEVKQRYATIVRELLAVNSNIILVIPYFPGFDFKESSSYYYLLPQFDEKFITNLLGSLINEVMLPIAREHSLPVIDLSNTFPAYDLNFYRYSCGYIEPSERGGEVIAELVAQVVGDKIKNYAENFRYFLDLSSTGSKKSPAVYRHALHTDWINFWKTIGPRT